MALSRVETDGLKDSAVTAAKIADGTVVAAEIADAAITTAKLLNGAVTAAMIDPAVELGGPSLGTSSVIRTNANAIGEDITFLTNTNGLSAGTVTINDTYTVTITDGTEWVIL